MATLDLNDIQGLIVRGYPALKEASYAILRITDIAKAKQWILSIIPGIIPATNKEPLFALHIAFTNSGMQHFFKKEDYDVPFSREFLEGITHSERSRILGDTNANDPKDWRWGNAATKVDLVLMAFAADKVTLQQKLDALIKGDNGLENVIMLETKYLDGVEPFGFADGISNPYIHGLGEEKRVDTIPDPGKTLDQHTIMPGEFIMGYLNEYNKLPFSPSLKEGATDIGKNGTYMVIRELEQDVDGFWNFIKSHSQEPELLAAKMIGRYKDGKPITIGGASSDDQNDFLYREKDLEGFGCPVGAHIRKMNPRDGIDNDAEISIAISRHHRIIRRGRAFSDNERKGLFFICLNTQLNRQFEFIQHSWANNPKFDGLYNDIDPIIGVPIHGISKEGEFTVPATPYRKKIPNIPQFVTVKGGAYFFLPGINCLKLMAQ